MVRRARAGGAQPEERDIPARMQCKDGGEETRGGADGCRGCVGVVNAAPLGSAAARMAEFSERAQVYLVAHQEQPTGGGGCGSGRRGTIGGGLEKKCKVMRLCSGKDSYRWWLGGGGCRSDEPIK